MHTWLAVIWLGCGACFAGVGPNAGFDVKRGWFADPHGMFVAGPNLSVASASSGHCAGFPQVIDASNHTVFEVALEMRYVREWQFVLASQIGCAGHVTGD